MDTGVFTQMYVRIAVLPQITNIISLEVTTSFHPFGSDSWQSLLYLFTFSPSSATLINTICQFLTNVCSQRMPLCYISSLFQFLFQFLCFFKTSWHIKPSYFWLFNFKRWQDFQSQVTTPLSTLLAAYINLFIWIFCASPFFFWFVHTLISTTSWHTYHRSYISFNQN